MRSSRDSVSQILKNVKSFDLWGIVFDRADQTMKFGYVFLYTQVVRLCSNLDSFVVSEMNLAL